MTCKTIPGQPTDDQIEAILEKALTDPTNAVVGLFNTFGTTGLSLMFRFQNNPRGCLAIIDRIFELAKDNPLATTNLQNMVKTWLWTIELTAGMLVHFVSGVKFLPDNTPISGFVLLIEEGKIDSSWIDVAVSMTTNPLSLPDFAANTRGNSPVFAALELALNPPLGIKNYSLLPIFFDKNPSLINEILKDDPLLQTPLAFAICKKDTDLIIFLLQRKPDFTLHFYPDCNSTNNETTLGAYLIELFASDLQTYAPFLTAMTPPQDSIIDILLQEIDMPNRFAILDTLIGGSDQLSHFRLSTNNTLLDEAISKNLPNAINKLISAGFNLNSPSNLYPDTVDQTPRISMVALLIASKDNPRLNTSIQNVTNFSTIKNALQKLINNLIRPSARNVTALYLKQVYDTLKHSFLLFSNHTELSTFLTSTPEELNAYLASINATVDGWPQSPYANSEAIRNLRPDGTYADHDPVSMLNVITASSSDQFAASDYLGLGLTRISLGVNFVGDPCDDTGNYYLLSSISLNNHYRTSWGYIDYDGNAHPAPGLNLKIDFWTNDVNYQCTVVFDHEFIGSGSALDWAPVTFGTETDETSALRSTLQKTFSSVGFVGNPPPPPNSPPQSTLEKLFAFLKKVFLIWLNDRNK